MTNYNLYTLPDGMRVIHLPSSSPVVFCGIAVAAGTRHEQPGEEGLAHFCEHLSFKGTARRSAVQVINAIEGLGGELNAFTNKEDTVYYCAILRDHVRRATDVLCDIVFDSQYPAAEVEKEREVVCDEIESYEDSPAELIFDDIEDLLFDGHPLGHNILGTTASVRSLGSDDARRFTARHYRPDRCVFFASGDVDFGRLVKWIDRPSSPTHSPTPAPSHSSPTPDPSLGGEGSGYSTNENACQRSYNPNKEGCQGSYNPNKEACQGSYNPNKEACQGKDSTANVYTPLPPAGGAGGGASQGGAGGGASLAGASLAGASQGGAVVTRDRGTHQAHVVIAAPSFAATDARRWPLYLLNNILGGPGLNSRLSLSLRERRGLVYSVESSMVAYSDTGIWTTYFGCDPADIGRCRRLVRSELDRLMERPLTDSQLRNAKRQLQGQLAIVCDNREHFALDFARNYLHTGTLRDLNDIMGHIERLTPADLQQTAQLLFRPERITTLIYQ